MIAMAAARSTTPAAPTMVLLVRHGKTPSTGTVLPGRAPGLHLSDVGRSQAEVAAERIAGLDRPPVAVYASPLERTRETAQPIARALGLRVRTAKGLLECDFGSWTGKKLDRLRKLPEWSQVQRSPSTFRFPGGESFSEMASRSWQTVVDLAEAHPGQTIVAVSHADPIKAILSNAAGAPLDMFQRLSVSPCSVSAVLIGPHGPHVLTVSSTASLQELSPS
jgi:probable phosphoglycerate mutase